MANDTTNSQTRILFQKYELKKDDVFASKKQGFQIVTRMGIEKIQRIENIKVTFDVITATKDYAAVKVRATKGDDWVETLSSAARGEFKETGTGNKKRLRLVGGSTDSWYVLEIAEKRGLSRAVLKLLNLYEHGIFGEDENPEDFGKKSDENSKKADAVLDEIVGGK